MEIVLKYSSSEAADKDIMASLAIEHKEAP
jgi:hypothetical protein